WNKFIVNQLVFRLARGGRLDLASRSLVSYGQQLPPVGHGLGRFHHAGPGAPQKLLSEQLLTVFEEAAAEGGLVDTVVGPAVRVLGYAVAILDELQNVVALHALQKLCLAQILTPPRQPPRVRFGIIPDAGDPYVLVGGN